MDINGYGVGRVTAQDLINDAQRTNHLYTLNDDQINTLLGDSLAIAQADAEAFLPNFQAYPENVRRVVLDMSYNLGGPRLRGFRNFRRALINQNYQEAANEMIDSNWYRQVGRRGRALVNLMRNVQ